MVQAWEALQQQFMHSYQLKPSDFDDSSSTGSVSEDSDLSSYESSYDDGSSCCNSISISNNDAVMTQQVRVVPRNELLFSLSMSNLGVAQHLDMSEDEVIPESTAVSRAMMLDSSSRYQIDASTANRGTVGGIRRCHSYLGLTTEEHEDDDEEEESEKYDEEREESTHLTPTALHSVQHDISPQDFLEELYRDNGLPTDIIPYRHCFYLAATNDQRAAWDHNLICTIRAKDLKALKQRHVSGKTLQACNEFGESVVHLCVRRGTAEMLEFLINQAGVTPRVCCENGRTPLHDCAWTWTREENGDPSHKIILLLQNSPELLWVADNRGAPPLKYIPKDKWSDFCSFIEENADLFMVGGAAS